MAFQDKKIIRRDNRNLRGRNKFLMDKKRTKKTKVNYGIIHLNCSFNNTIATLTTLSGSTLAWSSAGLLGFKGSKRTTTHAAQLVGEHIAKQAKGLGFYSVNIWTKGFGYGRDSVVRGIKKRNLRVNLIKDVTPIPFNGCRLKKPRRV